ncbi:MAG: hypothetical protein QCI82_02965 [Candidatus Thermoplasmatota archaeon]|nr:hypothetical protein [Candidatus Thermoplasmatota archaeon]
MQYTFGGARTGSIEEIAEKVEKINVPRIMRRRYGDREKSLKQKKEIQTAIKRLRLLRKKAHAIHKELVRSYKHKVDNPEFKEKLLGGITDKFFTPEGSPKFEKRREDKLMSEKKERIDAIYKLKASIDKDIEKLILKRKRIEASLKD